MIAQDLRPISIADNQGFRDFCNTMDPRYTVPSRLTIKSLIKALGKKTKDSLKKELEETKWVAITSDLWTDRTMRIFVALTSHFLDSEGSLKTATLSCDSFHQRENGDNIAIRIQSILQDYGIEDKLVCGCTDAGSNIKKAFKDAGIPRIHCFAHCLNLCVKEAFKVMESADMELHYNFGYKALR